MCVCACVCPYLYVLCGDVNLHIHNVLCEDSLLEINV